MGNTLNKRQDAIIAYIVEKKEAAVSQVFGYIQKHFDADIAKITINRDLKKLVDEQIIERFGAGRSVKYRLSMHAAAVQPIDVEEYFAKESGERDILKTFNFAVFDHLDGMFTKSEEAVLTDLKKRYTKKIAALPPDALQKELERFTIELSWKSSQIEGNTYSLLETEQLIREHTEAAGHTKEEAVMILNHKKALDYISEATEQFQSLSRKKIEDVHALIIDDLGVSKGLRTVLVGITGTEYTPLDNQHQIRDALEQTCTVVNAEKNPFAKTLLALLLIAYIQPFVDGNKRTSRLVGNAILTAHGCPPLSYRSVDELEYKKAVLLFYEQNNLSYFKHLFLEQLEFSVENYFG
jgi:Fic family protein